MIRYLSLGEVVHLHRRLIDQSGGSHGLRDIGALESAVAQLDASNYRTATIESARELAGQSAEMWEQRYRDVEFAPTRPLFGSAFVDHADRLWISELPWPSRFAAPKRWSVFSPDGLWLADVEAPDGVTLHDAWENQVVGTWRDGLGVSFVRVYELDAG